MVTRRNISNADLERLGVKRDDLIAVYQSPGAMLAVMEKGRPSPVMSKSGVPISFKSIGKLEEFALSIGLKSMPLHLRMEPYFPGTSQIA